MSEKTEVLAWLARIGEDDPVVIRETLQKCRSNDVFRAAFVAMARNPDAPENKTKKDKK
tara:strand:- start:275 stop:451 length:177 start_codon:yes stop_codon:yes gene_type:complete